MLIPSALCLVVVFCLGIVGGGDSQVNYQRDSAFPLFTPLPFFAAILIRHYIPRIYLEFIYSIFLIIAKLQFIMLFTICLYSSNEKNNNDIIFRFKQLYGL